MTPRKLLLPLLLVATATATTSGCAIFVSLPETPGLGNLSEGQVFSMAPPPEWPAPQPDNPQTASVDVSCGIGPRLSTGQLYAAVSIKGRPAATALPAMNIALVLDRSGSMHGEPFRNMIIAAQTFVSQLRDGDRVSVVAFSGGVYLAAPPVIIDANTRNMVSASIGTLVDGGGTNFSGGYLAGLAQVFGAFNPWQLNQVVLFSDGQPNIGITSSSELARIAARAAEHGVATTTIGFGMEHDELLMQGMADASGGNYYYVDEPGDMPKIFQQEAGAILRTAARSTDVDMVLPPGIVLEDVIGYDYVNAGGHTYVRIGSVPHDQERFVVFRFQQGGGGQLPIGLVYSDLSRRGRFAVSCGPGYDGRMGGRDSWALQLAGRSEAAWGLSEAMSWADSGSEIFVISQIGYTRGIIATMRERLGPQALGEEDKMLLDAQMNLGLKVGTEAAHSFMSGGVSGLMNFGKQQVASNAATAVSYNIDKTFHVRVRLSVQTNYNGQPGTRFVARGTPYKARDRDASLKFKRARYSSYKMMRSR